MSVIKMMDLDQDAGLVFSTERDGTICDIGAMNWNAFAGENGAPELKAEAVLGRNLFDFIQGKQVRACLVPDPQQIAKPRGRDKRRLRAGARQ